MKVYKPILLPFLNIVCYSKLLLTKHRIRHWHVTPTFAFKALHTWYRKWSRTYKNISTSTKNIGYTSIFSIHFISLLFLVFTLFLHCWKEGWFIFYLIPNLHGSTFFSQCSRPRNRYVHRLIILLQTSRHCIIGGRSALDALGTSQ